MSSRSVIFRRALDLKLPKGRSAFLWGPRKTGKTTYLKERFPRSRRYDLLESDLFLRLSKEPHRLREEILLMGEADRSRPIIIDEIQKVPALLDEVHGLIESLGVSFILCGSSARKLRRGAANLLGGRAWRYQMFPLTRGEIPAFDLPRALNAGLIPSHYLGEDPPRSLKAYVFDYLQEEIRAEGLTRNVPAFLRFLDSLAFGAGEMTNYANVARDCGVDAKTVKEYYQILVDTMLGYLILPYAKRPGRDVITATPKFYWFDVGIPNVLSGESVHSLRGAYAGRQFENLILMEIMAYRGYSDADFKVNFWRTKTGLEVDFILGGEAAIEVKSAARVDQTQTRGLQAFLGAHKVSRAIIVSDELRPRRVAAGHASMDVLPWRIFLDQLWSGEVI